MVQNSNYGLEIDKLEGCPWCGSRVLKHYENNQFKALQCQYCLAIGGILLHIHFADSEYLDSSRWQLVYSRWNKRFTP
jgi:hypothetical protein